MDIDNQQMAEMLAELGFMAVNHYYLPDALAIAEGLQIVRPKSAVPWVIKALVDMSRGKSEQALTLLREEALPLEPDNESVKVVLALALQKMGHNRESEALLAELEAHTTATTPSIVGPLLQTLRSQ